MALSGSFTGTTGNKYVQPKIVWSAVQDIRGNYSDVTAHLYYSRTNSGYTTYGTWSGGITINGNRATGSHAITVTQNSNTWAISHTVRVYHNNDGTKSVVISADGGISGTSSSTTSCSATITLDKIPRYCEIDQNSVSNFTDEENPSLSFTNPSNGYYAVRVKIEAGGNNKLIIRDIPSTSTSYTFDLSEDERNKLRNLITKGNELSVIITVCCMDGETELSSSYVNRTMTLVNYMPTMNPTIIDEGSASYKLTNNRNAIIRYFNYPIVTFDSEAKKGARIVSRSVTCGSYYKTSDADGDWIHLNNVDSNVFTLTVTDNRGHSTTQTVTKTPYYEYVPVTCHTVIDKDLQPDNTVNISITITGDFYDDSFGAVYNDLITEYRYKKDNEPYPTDENGNDIWEQAELIEANVTKYLAGGNILKVDYRGTYTIQTRARDSVHVAYSKEEVVRIVPTFDWSKNDFNFNVPIFKEGNPVGYYPIGGIYTSSDATNPGEMFGGEWALMQTYHGGELLAYGSAWNEYQCSLQAISGSDYGFSDILPSGVYASHLSNYMPEILTASSGTIWVQTKGIIGLVEATVEISGQNSGCTGIWFLRQNKNALPSQITLTGGQGLMTVSGSYGGASTKYFYNVSDSDTGSDFFVNPMWRPYGGNFNPGISGTKATLQVKAYAKGKVTYMWKRVA